MRELGFTDEVGEMAEERGLVETYAYHCNKCNYVWLPRDFDRLFYTQNTQLKDWGEDLLYRDAPKSCARCKSRQGKDIIPQRKLKSNSPALKIKPIKDMVEKYGDNADRWFTSIARLRSLARQEKYTLSDIFQIHYKK